MLNRRHFLETAALASAVSGLGAGAAFAERDRIELGDAVPFSFDELVAMAKDLAAADYQEPEIRHPDILETIDYDAFQQIVFKRELGLGEGTNVNFPVQLFHLGRYFKAPVKIHWLEQGRARAKFSTIPTTLRSAIPGSTRNCRMTSVFAGFRLQDGPGKRKPTGWLCSAALISGVRANSASTVFPRVRPAIDTALSTPEEFPAFTAFWLQPGTVKSDEFTILCADGRVRASPVRSAWSARRQARSQQDIKARFFARQDIKRMGIAPLTSMFLVRRAQSASSARLAAGDP